MSNIFRVSHSKAKTWRKCRRAYWYRYIMKLRRKFVSRPLRFGRIAHEMIEAHANGDDPMKLLRKIEKEQGALFRSQREELGEIVTDAQDIMSDYFDYWEARGDMQPVRMKGKSGEFSFEVEIASGIVAVGKIDKIAKERGLRWLVEHKTFSNLPSEDHRWRNLQGAIYIRINEMLKLPKLDGVLWDYIRSKPPTSPKILKSGQMSARAIDTLPSRVRRVFKEEGLDIKDKKFSALVKLAEKNQGNYFQRIRQAIKPKVVDILFADFVETAKEMADQHGDVKARNIDRHCDWCDYEGICRAELQGLDAKFIMRKDYEISKFKNEEEPDFEG